MCVTHAGVWCNLLSFSELLGVGSCRLHDPTPKPDEASAVDMASQLRLNSSHGTLTESEMRITIILPFINPSGGVLSTFFLSNALVSLGHKVNVVYPVWQPSFGQWIFNFKRARTRLLNTSRHLLGAFDYSWIPIRFNLKKVPYLSARFIPESDFVIATAWPTAYFTDSLPESKGTKVYFVRGIETWSGPEQKVLNTYKLGMNVVTTSRYLESELTKMGVKVKGRVPNGVDTGLFYPDPAGLKKRNGRRVLLMYHRIGLKGFEIGLKAVSEAKKQVDLELVLFGTYKPPKISVEFEYHRNLFGAELRRLYSSCDVFLWTSVGDGWGQPPMEAQACKSALIATSSGGIPEYTVPGETALVSDKPDPSKLSEHLIELIRSREERERLQDAGYRHIQRFSWVESAKKLEDILSRL